jgi:hypothetical protein
VVNFDTSLLEAAHKKSIFNKSEILKSNLCGCFSCLKIYPTVEIKEWVDEGEGKKQTPLCPYCSIDSVLGDASPFPITDIEFLKAMQKRWFR